MQLGGGTANASKNKSNSPKKDESVASAEEIDGHKAHKNGDAGAENQKFEIGEQPKKKSKDLQVLDQPKATMEKSQVENDVQNQVSEENFKKESKPAIIELYVLLSWPCKVFNFQK